MMRSDDECAPAEAPSGARDDPAALGSAAPAGRTLRGVPRGPHSAYHNARTRLTGHNAVLLCRYALLRLRRRNLRTGYVHVGRGADIVIGPRARVHFGREVRFMRDFTGHFMGRVTLGDGVFFNRVICPPVRVSGFPPWGRLVTLSGQIPSCQVLWQSRPVPSSSLDD